MSLLYRLHPSTRMVLERPQSMESKILNGGLSGREHRDGEDEKLVSVLLLPEQVVFALDNHETVIFPGVSFGPPKRDPTAMMEILCTKKEADQFGAAFFSFSSEVYTKQNLWEWDKVACRSTERVNLRQLLGAQGAANPVVLVATDNLIAMLGEEDKTRRKRVKRHNPGDIDASPLQYSPETEQKVNPTVVVFSPSNASSFFPPPDVNTGYNWRKTFDGYMAATLDDFFEVRMPGRVMALLPFPIAVATEHHEDSFFLQDLFHQNATYSFLVERIHWKKFVRVVMPLFSKEQNTLPLPEYYNKEE